MTFSWTSLGFAGLLAVAATGCDLSLDLPDDDQGDTGEGPEGETGESGPFNPEPPVGDGGNPPPVPDTSCVLEAQSCFEQASEACLSGDATLCGTLVQNCTEFSLSCVIDGQSDGCETIANACFDSAGAACNIDNDTLCEVSLGGCDELAEECSVTGPEPSDCNDELNACLDHAQDICLADPSACEATLLECESEYVCDPVGPQPEPADVCEAFADECFLEAEYACEIDPFNCEGYFNECFTLVSECEAYCQEYGCDDIDPGV